MKCLIAVIVAHIVLVWSSLDVTMHIKGVVEDYRTLCEREVTHKITVSGKKESYYIAKDCRVILPEGNHIKLGSGKDIESGMRVGYFAYNDENVVVVLLIGRPK